MKLTRLSPSQNRNAPPRKTQHRPTTSQIEFHTRIVVTVRRKHRRRYSGRRRDGFIGGLSRHGACATGTGNTFCEHNCSWCIARLPRRQNAAEPPATRKLTISEALRIPEAVLYSLFGLAIMAVLRFTRAKAGNSLVPPKAGGLLIGSAQALSLLLTSSPLGVSTTYEHLSRHILQALSGKPGKPSLPSKPIIFSLGVIAGSFALLQRKPGPSFDIPYGAIPAWQAFIGGTVLAFGARLGGGCTSGHGLSGLSAMSFSSLVTVTCMFGAGILTRMLM
jgi:uncharacterized membrane protein YedE/YeeE